MPSIGPMEVIIVLALALIVLGPKKLPDLGRSLGTGMREFKDSVSGVNPAAQPRGELVQDRPETTD
jgi:sec-independent protein translocase protein TatA